MDNNRDMQIILHIKTYCEDVAKTILRFGNNYEIFARHTQFT